MAVFAAGTLPLLFLVGMGSSFALNNYKKQLSRLMPIFIVLIGALFILRGLNLDLPYLSPKIEQGEKVSCH